MEAAGQAVESWFGPAFAHLHPLLQQLHRQGGDLSGQVTVAYGKGLAGRLGRSVAAKLGLPPQEGSIALSVHIHSTRHALHWVRAFGAGQKVTSVFTPVGSWPDGHWVESVGGIRAELRVDTSGGGWRWVPKRTSIYGLAVPRWLAPQLDAFKRVTEAQYQFAVTVSHPLLGTLFAYSGTLAAT